MKNMDNLTLILAGGNGTRLSVLTKETPKPAINFGGSYRLIDFTLSNCKHSNVGDIGLITQYCQKDLANYVGSGSQWLPENGDAKLTILSPRTKNGIIEFYKGTADAILRNTDFIEQYNPRNILVLAGDHVYKMDYSKMLEEHENSRAAVTIAAKIVPIYDASRFGIMDVDRNNEIIRFEEKPRRPKSNLASMGVYVFNWAILKNYLINSSMEPESGMDIGSDIIPEMIMTGEKLAAYMFNGYWKDVGDIRTLWEASMELLSDPPSIRLNGDGWDIISRNNCARPHQKHSYSKNGHIVNALVTEDSIVRGTVMRSVISSDVEIGEDAKVVDSVIMPGAKIGRGSFILKSIIGSNAIVDEYTAIGDVTPDGKRLDNYQGISVVGNEVNVCTRIGLSRLSSAADFFLPQTNRGFCFDVQAR